MMNVIKVSDVKDRILAIAQTYIEARNYTEVSVAHICQQVGIKQNSFYRFFPTKQDLTLELMERAWVAYQPLLKEAFHNDIAPIDRFERYLKMDYQYQQQVADGYYSPFSSFVLELSQQDEVSQQRLVQMQCDIQAYFKRALQEAVLEGHLPDVDVSNAAASMLAYLQGLSIMAHTHQQPHLMAQLGQSILRLALPDNMLHQAMSQNIYSSY